MVLEGAARKGDQLRIWRAAYPLFGRLMIRKRRALPYWRIEGDGRITDTLMLDVKDESQLVLFPRKQSELRGQWQMPALVPLMLCVINGQAQWLLEEPCPVPDEDEARRAAMKDRYTQWTRALEKALMGEGLCPEMLGQAEADAFYERCFQVFAKERVARGLRDPAMEKPPSPLRLHRLYRAARVLDVTDIDREYAALPSGEYFVLLGRMGVCARVRADHLPSLRLLDSFIQQDVYLVDADLRHCLSGQSDLVEPPYQLAKGEPSWN